MMTRIKNGEGNGIICWELSRLARNPDEAGKIMGMLQRGEIKHIKTYSKDYYSEDNAVISSVEFGMANQYSRDVGKGVRRGINKKAAMGWRPARAPLGYLNTKTNLKGEQEIYNDPIRFPLMKGTFQRMLTENYTTPKLLNVANKELHLTMPATKKRLEHKLQLSTLYRILTDPFYYGWYRWNGEWIKGNHEAMITEEEFDRIQFLLGRKGKPRPKTHKFAFTGIMHCASCNAMITAEEKFKRQKNGNVHHYIYYHCTRKINPDCTEKSIELKDLEQQIDGILSDLQISERFQQWALKYLHEIRKDEAKAQESSLGAKQKRLMQVKQQLNNVVLLYTSTDNADKRLLSSDEYQSVKTSLMKEQEQLEDGVKQLGEESREWVELTERTFNFALYAHTWFANGDLDTKRAIFACLGSDLLLKDQKVLLTLHKPFQYIFERKNAAEAEIARLEPLKNAVAIGDLRTFEAQFPVMSG